MVVAGLVWALARNLLASTGLRRAVLAVPVLLSIIFIGIVGFCVGVFVLWFFEIVALSILDAVYPARPWDVLMQNPVSILVMWAATTAAAGGTGAGISGHQVSPATRTGPRAGGPQTRRRGWGRAAPSTRRLLAHRARYLQKGRVVDVAREPTEALRRRGG